MITILNAHSGVRPSDRPGIFWCDRHSPVGNPFRLLDDADRSKVCSQYKVWFYDIAIKDQKVQEYLETMRQYLKANGYIYLLCWCVPKQCHVETIAEWLEANPL
ncbi:MAG TPA: hypothetical protein DD713_03340 [Nitrospiraceae bacterium]|nr:hypothetical protein [Nitrospiraceae bacterium]